MSHDLDTLGHPRGMSRWQCDGRALGHLGQSIGWNNIRDLISLVFPTDLRAKPIMKNCFHMSTLSTLQIMSLSVNDIVIQCIGFVHLSFTRQFLFCDGDFVGVCQNYTRSNFSYNGWVSFKFSVTIVL